MVQLAQIEGFLAVAREGNLSRAATALYVTQPALTARIAALEADIGARLFVRNRRGMTLTQAGRAYLPHAERALQSLQRGAASVAGTVRGSSGELAIGGAPAVSTYVLPWTLVRFAEARPQVRLVVRTGHSEEVVEMVLSGEVQVGLIRELRDPRVVHVPLYEDGLELVADPSHPLAAEGRMRLDRIGETRLILFDKTSSYYELTSALFRAAGVTPLGTMELDNIDAAKKMVARRLGVALLPATAVAEEVASGRLRRIALIGAPPLRRRIEAVLRRDAEVDAAALGPFMDLLRTIPGYVPGAVAIGT
ncbi:MAG TPA: LysR family transcriptional regulator [Candidatus Limnocylindrales bacterium]|nr:LysR family transcriptional regulator [Candidatus Limnocylindrales bacterium]